MNAKIEPHHKDEAAKAAGFKYWADVPQGHSWRPYMEFVALALANNEALSASLEKATSDLREIDRNLVRFISNPQAQDAVMQSAELASQYRAEPDQDAEDLKAILAAYHHGNDHEDSRASAFAAALAKLREIKGAGK